MYICCVLLNTVSPNWSGCVSQIPQGDSAYEQTVHNGLKYHTQNTDTVILGNAGRLHEAR